jgi:CRISPR/Cas system endoribonuclease Cas6 (RAMP superfamily)
MWQALQVKGEEAGKKPDRGKKLPRKTLPWPDPDRCFYQWWSKWPLYAEEPVRGDLPLWVNRHVGVSGHEGRTKRVNLAEEGKFSRVFIGYVGTAEFSLLGGREVPEEVKRDIWTLARFSTYCGTGLDTLRGMGQTQRSE